jgi:signal transduction histidine kinase
MERHSAELEGAARARGGPAGLFLEGVDLPWVEPGVLEQCYADAAALALRDPEVQEGERARLLASLSRWVWERGGGGVVSAERLGAWMHDLRTPLVPLNYINMALDGAFGPLNAGQRRCLGVAARNTRALEDQIGVFQTFLHAQRGGLAPRMQEVSVPDLVERAAVFWGEVAERQGVKWSLRVPSEGRVVGDLELLVRATRALLDNALRACSEGGEVCLGAELHAGGAVCFVEDTGCGMSEEALSRLSGPFERGFGGRGLGLGLTVARAIVEAHGAALCVRSAPGRGTRVSFELQAAAA